jgi:hypothetical protein
VILQVKFAPTVLASRLEVWEIKEGKNHANSGTAPSLQRFTTRGEVQSTEGMFRHVSAIFNTPVQSLSAFHVHIHSGF